MFLSDLYNNKRLFENISPIDLAEIIFNSLMQKYPEAVQRYGHEVVGDAVIDYAEDAEDIHSMSDIDIAVAEILDDLENFRGDRTNDLEPDNLAPLQENKDLSIQDLAVISDQALDAAYGYGRSSPGNTFGWQANLQSAAYAKKVIDGGVTDIETIADAIHKGWNKTAKAFVNNPDQFSDTEKLKAAGKLDAKLQQRAKLMQIDYAALPEDEKEKDRVVARVLLQAIKGQNPVTENLRKWFKEKWVRFGPDGKIRGACARGDESEGKPKCLPQAKAHALGKKGRKYAAAKKRREDPNPERRGPAKNVATKKKANEGVAEGRFDEPLTGWHIVYRNSGNPVHATPSFETKEQAQKFLMTKMFANHQDYKVVHTAGVGVAEGSGKNVVKSVKVGNFRHDLVDTGMGWQVRIYNGDELYDTGMSKNSEQKGLAALEDAVAYTEKQTRTKRQSVAEGSLVQVLQWPEIVNKVNGAMKAMGWKGQRKSDDAFMFSTKGQETDDQFYIVMIENQGNDVFTYALGTVEEGDPHIGEQETLPMTAASVSELMNSIREGFGLNEQGVAEGGIATVDWPDEDPDQGSKQPPVSIGGTFDARPVVKQGSLVKAIGLPGVHRVMQIRGDQAKIIQEIPNTGTSTYFPMKDLRVWTNKPITREGVAEGRLNEFSTGGGDEDPFDAYPCYDCGSTIFLHHTKSCDLAEPNAIRDLPEHPGTQHWTGQIPKGLHPIPGLQEGVAEATAMPMSDYNIDLFQQLVQNYKPKSHAGELVKKALIGGELFPKSETTLQLIDEIYYENIENGYQGPSFPEEVSDLRFYRKAMKKSLYQGVAEQKLDEACWKGYHKEGNKKMFGKTYPNCVKNEGVAKGFNGISVDIEPELDYDVVYVDINGKKHNFNYWYSDEKPTDELGFRKDIPQYLKREEWYNRLDQPTKMEILHAVVQAELGKEPSEYKPTVDDEPLDLDEHGVVEVQQLCPECGGPAFSNLVLAEKQDACYHKVKSRYKVWPSAYASGALVQCRKKGAANWGNKKTNEAKESPAQDYQKMMNFVQSQRLSGVPAEQQVAVALFKELEKTKAFNKELDAELKAAGQRADIGAEQSELATKELGKHRGELEKEKQKQQASRQQLQSLSQQLEQLKTAPNVDPEASQAIEQQIAELEQKMQDRQGTGVSADKIAELEQAIANVQKGETVDAEAIQRLEQQFKAAETAAQAAREKVGQVKDYESQIAKLNAEIENLEIVVAKTLKPEVDRLDNQVFAQGNLINQVIQKTIVPSIKDDPNYAKNLANVAKKQLSTTNQRPTVQNPQIQLDLPDDKSIQETRFYFSPKATLAETLRSDFAMTQDRDGWYLTAAQGPAKLLEAQRAFGIPKVKQVKLKEVRISDYTGRAGTIGDDNATSPIGSLPRQGRKHA